MPEIRYFIKERKFILPGAIKEKLKTSKWSSWHGSTMDCKVNDGFDSLGKAEKNFILGKIPAINMLFLLLLNMYNNHQVIAHLFGEDLCRSTKMYCLIVMLYRQIDDFLILNHDPIRVPKIISVIIKLFYNGTAIT